MHAIGSMMQRVMVALGEAIARVSATGWRVKSVPSPTYALTRWCFLRVMGLVYLSAFWSLETQIVGLVGQRGIVPAGVGDVWLRGVCMAAAALASLLILGVAPFIALPLLWGTYLWLSTIAGPFLSYQWDALLLEAGFLTIFISPIVWLDRRRSAVDPPRLGVWLMLWLLFRLMAESGVVKLASGDPTWRDLSALNFHYETQPIPTPLAWWAHHLPAWVERASTAGVLGVELAAPLLMLGPRRVRILAFVLLAGLQLLIALTGNYAFFNLLTVALCLFLLDDAALSRSRHVREAKQSAHEPRLQSSLPYRIQHGLLMVVAIVTVPVSLLYAADEVRLQLPGLSLVVPMAQAIAPLRSVNGYGLFAVMTTTRNEIVLEGSDDGVNWQEYEFAYKPGDVRRPPPWVAPHQPRLDWQMWFAALDRFDDQAWLQALCVRLLEGSPPVLRLLATDPFQGRSPRTIRGVLYRYHFSDGDARRRGIWWTRERLGLYSPPLSLRASWSPGGQNHLLR